MAWNRTLNSNTTKKVDTHSDVISHRCRDRARCRSWAGPLRVLDGTDLVRLLPLTKVQSTDEGRSCGHFRTGIGNGSGA
jgi:hypothetical protein